MWFCALIEVTFCHRKHLISPRGSHKHLTLANRRLVQLAASR